MGGRWPYSCCFVGCCFQDLFNIACSILVQFLSSLVSVHVVHPYNRTDMTWPLLGINRFILSDKSDFNMINNLSIAVYAFTGCILMSFSVDETLLLRYMNLSSSFREPLVSVDMSPLWLKHIFCLHSHGGQCHLLPALDYAAGIQLG